MVDKIEMSLDDIIKSNKKQKGARSGTTQSTRRAGSTKGRYVRRESGGSPRKTGGILKSRNRGVQRASFSRGDVNSAWEHDMYDGPKRGGAVGILKKAASNDSSKLLVSNLDYGVSDSDIQELFAEFGPLKKAAVHYDRSGRSLGTADVVFERPGDAVKAIKQYNGVPLDGRPMNIQLATSDVSVFNRTGGPIKRKQTSTRSGPSPNRSQPRRGASNTKTNVGRRAKQPAPSAEELDAELDAYVNDMKI